LRVVKAPSPLLVHGGQQDDLISPQRRDDVCVRQELICNQIAEPSPPSNDRSEQQAEARGKQQKIHGQREGPVRQTLKDREAEPGAEQGHRNKLEWN
jgi:hypothetical protein